MPPSDTDQNGSLEPFDFNLKKNNQIYLQFERVKIQKTRGPLDHLLDTAIRCLRAKRVGITIAEKMAVEKLQFH